MCIYSKPYVLTKAKIVSVTFLAKTVFTVILLFFKFCKYIPNVKTVEILKSH